MIFPSASRLTPDFPEKAGKIGRSLGGDIYFLSKDCDQNIEKIPGNMINMGLLSSILWMIEALEVGYQVVSFCSAMTIMTWGFEAAEKLFFFWPRRDAALVIGVQCSDVDEALSCIPRSRQLDDQNDIRSS